MPLSSFPHKKLVKTHLFPHKSADYLHISLTFSNFALMKGYIYKDLLKWKDSRRRNPLMLYGVRQMGKDYLLRCR